MKIVWRTNCLKPCFGAVERVGQRFFKNSPRKNRKSPSLGGGIIRKRKCGSFIKENPVFWKISGSFHDFSSFQEVAGFGAGKLKIFAESFQAEATRLRVEIV